MYDLRDPCLGPCKSSFYLLNWKLALCIPALLLSFKIWLLCGIILWCSHGTSVYHVTEWKLVDCALIGSRSSLIVRQHDLQDLWANIGSSFKILPKPNFISSWNCFSGILGKQNLENILPAAGKTEPCNGRMFEFLLWPHSGGIVVISRLYIVAV